MSSSFARLFDAARRRLIDRGAQPIPQAAARRRFVRRAGVGALGVFGTGLMLPDEAWAGIEERAARAGITPGTVVDRHGRPLDEPLGNQPYVGELMLFAGNFPVRGWSLCEGQLLAVSQNDALFSILGTVYGGDGRTTFGLPDLRGRAAVGAGTGPGLTPRNPGQKMGVETATLNGGNLPAHTHTLPVLNAPGSSRTPGGNILAGDATGDRIYAQASTADNELAPTNATGGGQSFSTRDPFLGLNYQISLTGIYPSRT